MLIETDIEKPAFLLGNGLNNYANLPLSWIDLLIKISGNAISKEILEEKEITYPEFYDAVCFNNQKGMKDYVSLKNDICEEISKWRITPHHLPLIDFAQSNGIPILTTNYDGTLINDKILNHHKKLVSDKNILPLKTKNKGFTDYYPWCCYYSDHNVVNVLQEFAIWHIHGMQCYKRSISIGAIDYVNNINRLKNYLPVEVEGELNISINWIGKDSWVDVFFHCDLIILGLSLGYQETSLRWLLMEREKYFRKKPRKRCKTIYVINEQYDKYGKGKEYLLESLKITTKRYQNSGEIFSEIIRV